MTLDELLQDQASSLALGHLQPDAMRSTIDRALTEGIFLDVFIDAIYPGPHPPFDQPLKAFMALLAERAVAVPDRRQAMRNTIARHARRIAGGEIDARAGLSALIDAIYYEPELRDHVTKYLGDAFGMELLIGYHWSFDDLEERPDDVSVDGRFGTEAIDALKQLVRAEVIRWLAGQAR